MIRSSMPLVVKFEGAELPSSGVPVYPSSSTTEAMLIAGLVIQVMDILFEKITKFVPYEMDA